MKNLYLIAGIVTLLLFSCAQEGDGPVAVAQKFSTAVNTFKFEEARQYITPAFTPTFKTIEGAGSFMTEEHQKALTENALKRDTKYTLVNKDDSTATVAVGFKGGERDVMITLFMKKIANKWLVDRQENN